MHLFRMLRPPASFPFLSVSSRAAVLEAYERRVAALSLEVEERSVPTRFGAAHVLAAGPPQAPPLLALHGLNIAAPRNVEFFRPLAQHFRIYAPDTPGQPGRSTPAHLDWKRGDFGTWVLDVLDGLGLGRVPAAAVSFGAAMLLQAGILEPDRFDRAALVVPAGLVPVDLPRVLWRLVFPAMLYRLWPRRAFLQRQVRALSSEVTDDLLGLFELLAHNVYPARTPPPAFPAARLRRFTCPVMVAVASDDVFFPLERMRRGVSKLPGLVAVKVLEGRHIPTRVRQGEMNEWLLPFLREV